MPTLLVSGSLAYDLIADYPKLFRESILPEKIHALSVSFEVGELQKSYGGNAGNIAYTLALLSLKPILLGTVGNDFEPYRLHLQGIGVDCSHVRVQNDGLTSFAIIITDREDNQIAAFSPGAGNAPLTLPDTLWGADTLVVVAPNSSGNMGLLVAHCRKTNTPFIFDPGQQCERLSGDELSDGISGAKALFVNDYELEMVMRKTGLTEDMLLTKTDMLVTTLGAKGSRIRTNSETFDIPPAHSENTSDPTGAGDAYRAGFVVGLLKSWPLPVVGRFASTVACYTVERRGTQTHSFTWDDVRARYQKNFGESLPA